MLLSVLRKLVADAFGLSGPPRRDSINVWSGNFTLVAGSGSQVLPANVVPFDCAVITWRQGPGGTLGHLSGSYNGVDTVTATSSSGADTSVIGFCLIW